LSIEGLGGQLFARSLDSYVGTTELSSQNVRQ
jgi:hypothetical protein